MPNRLKYCGGDHNQELFHYEVAGQTDPGLAHLLQEFETLFPYLKMIAQSNHIDDPFDRRVVEAYWIGNELLEKIHQQNLYTHLSEGLKLKKKLSLPQFQSLMGAVNPNSLPHHNFHVFNIWLNNKNLPLTSIIQTLDSCRISSGKIISIADTELEVTTSTLAVENEKIVIQSPITKKITYKLLGQSFIPTPKINDIITIHWNFACDIISETRQRQLDFYTRQSLSR
jgi:hypothetical protein